MLADSTKPTLMTNPSSSTTEKSFPERCSAIVVLTVMEWFIFRSLLDQCLV